MCIECVGDQTTREDTNDSKQDEVGDLNCGEEVGHVKTEGPRTEGVRETCRFHQNRLSSTSGCYVQGKPAGFPQVSKQNLTAGECLPADTAALALCSQPFGFPSSSIASRMSGRYAPGRSLPRKSMSLSGDAYG
jgi:hypothetical protein